MPQESDVDRAKRWGKKFLADWKAGTTQAPRRSARPGPVGGDVGHMLGQYDPWPELVKDMGAEAQRHRLVMGVTGADGLLALTEARRNLLILGPPRSAKTVGVLVPAILGHPGPVVSTSTKDDVFRATAICRARLGRLWHYNPDGGETLPGCKPLRWSPIGPSKEWATAIALGKSMADVASIDSTGGDTEYFRTKASVLIAALLHAAGTADKDMMWMLRAVAGDNRILDEAYEILDDSFLPDAKIAASDLRGIRDLDPRSQGPILSTTANAFAAFRLPGALASTESPNFDPASFVVGDPTGYNPRRVAMRPLDQGDGDGPLGGLSFDLAAKGIYDTIYLTASSSRQALVAPLVAGLLNQIRDAAFAQHRLDESKDYFRRPATLWALDEVAGIAPMRDLPETLSQSGGQGLLVAACLQDLQLARAKWDKAADGFLTLFGNLVIHAGIRDETLQALSTVIGQHWIPVHSSMTSGGRTGGDYQSGWSHTESQQLVQNLEPGAIAQGRVAEHPDYVLGITPSQWGWFFATPYYRQPPWPQLLVASMEYAARYGSALEASWDVPMPILNQDGTHNELRAAGGEALVQHYETIRGYLAKSAERRRSFVKHHGPGSGSWWADYDDSWTYHYPAPRRSLIALRRDPGMDVLNAALVKHEPVRAGTPADTKTITFTMRDSVNVPLADMPGGSMSEVTPQWYVGSRHHPAFLNVVPGGVEAKVQSANTIIAKWCQEIPGAELLLEAWSWSAPAEHLVRRAAEALAEVSPSCFMTEEATTFYGTWYGAGHDGLSSVSA